jgi:hypothetical protein
MFVNKDRERGRNRRSLHCAPPHFLSRAVALRICIRLSLRRAVYVDVASSAKQEIGVRSGRDDNSVSPENPGLKSETWATHSFIRPLHFLRLAQVWQGRCFRHDRCVGIKLVLATHHLAGPGGV